MTKKIFLTSAAIMCMACPAFAENFPGDGNMLENKTYDNAATYTNTGIYEGTVVANADYSLNPYSVSAGSYFTGIDNSTNQATTATCTSGNYCPGVASTTYDNNAFGDTGLQSCPNGYASSDLGASANTQCYRTCDIANMGANGTIANIAHAATLTGNDYYGAGTDTCVPATCENGWHVKAAANIGNPDLTTLIGSSEAVNSETDGENFAVDFGNKGKIHGVATLDGGCFCSLNGYTPFGETKQTISSDYERQVSDPEASHAGVAGCASACSSFISHNYNDFRTNLFAAVSSSPASCEANVINITWNDASAADIAATGAATTVYEGDIKTPLKAVMKPGKTFVGWKFVKPAATPCPYMVESSSDLPSSPAEIGGCESVRTYQCDAYSWNGNEWTNGGKIPNCTPTGGAIR